MPYESDPVVAQFDKRFRRGTHGTVLRFSGTDYALQVSDEEYETALENFRTSVAWAKYGSLAIGCMALLFLYFRMISNAAGAAEYLLIATAGVARVCANGIAMWSAFRPFRRRLHNELVARRGWRRRGLIEGVRSARIPLILWLMFSVLTVLAIWVVRDHNRRVNLFASGHQAQAVVTFSGTARGRGNICLVRFQLAIDQSKYEGSSTQCRLRDAHPAGSKIAVRYDPTDPDGVLADGDTSWNALVAIPILAWPLLSLIFVVGIIPMALGYVPNSKRHSRLK